MYKKASTRIGANNLTGWSMRQQGGFKASGPSKGAKSKKSQKPEFIPIREWAKSEAAAVRIICLKCLHQTTVNVSRLMDTFQLDQIATIRDLKPRLKCYGCQTKGMVAIQIIKGE